MFDVAAVEAGIAGTRFAGGVRHFVRVGSTNQLAVEAAERGEPGRVWVADEQTAGRGRGGHGWHSAAGEGLYLSVLVRPEASAGTAARLPLHTGLAVQAAVLEVTGLELDLRWPNDLMFGERKCGGILVESAAGAGAGAGSGTGGGTLRYAVIGIGLNVNHRGFPGELAGSATSLFLEDSRGESGRRFEREPLAAAILRHMDEELKRLGEARLAERMRAASSWVEGKRVRVGADEPGSEQRGAGGYTGWTRGLDGDGFLKVEGDDGVMRTVYSGGVRAAKE